MIAIPDPHNNKNLTRREFIISSGLAIGSFTITGGLCQACSLFGNKEKQENLAIEFIGPEGYFPFYKNIFKRIKKVSLYYKTLEEALFTESNAAIVLTPIAQKASVILVLLEMGKDILTPFPLATDYIEFDAIQKQCNMMNCRLAMLDPIRYTETVKSIRKFISDNHAGKIHSVDILVDPDYHESNYYPYIEGFCGIGTSFVRLISYILGRNPISLTTKDFEAVNLLKSDKKVSLELDFNGITVSYKKEYTEQEWTIMISGKKTDLVFDSTGQVKASIETDTFHNLKQQDEYKADAFTKNIQDFIVSIRNRKEPEVNTQDGMAGIALNLAAVMSARTGSSVKMIMDHYGKCEDERWVKTSKVY